MIDGLTRLYEATGQPRWIESSLALARVMIDEFADAERAHPVVIRHPLTGRIASFLNPLYVTRLDGLTEAESRPILDQIQQHGFWSPIWLKPTGNQRLPLI